MPRFETGPRFEVRRRLGAGGMGVVFEAYDHDRQELVALKTLRRHDAHWLARFKREFRSVHALSHPNLVAIHELFDTAAEPFFTMELVRGVDFLAWVREKVRRDGDSLSYDERRLRSALGQLANAVAALHAGGKIHRDIKPSNILVTADGRLVLLDFGLLYDATRASAASDERGAGTAAYMAPEQAFDGSITPAADWYSVGVVLFEALTGQLPHTGRTRYELMIRKQSEDAPAPRQLVASVPEDLDALCVDLLRRDPIDRLASPEIVARLAKPDPGAPVDPAAANGPHAISQRLFIGRDAELAELRRAYDHASSGPLIYVVEGESGLGKSCLVERFLETLSEAEPDAVILSARCYEREMVAYKALDGLVDALARYLRHLPTVEVAEVMPRRAALLGRLFPVLKRVDAIAMAPDVRDLPEPQGQRRRMFAALRELFLRIAARRRLVWFIDDLQWTDADSLVLLQELLAHEHALPVLLIATTRVIDDAAHRSLLATLQDLAPVERRALAELRPDETRELAAALMPDRDAATLDAAAA
ncbi:MAG TPA: protein kinase, partial [Kofleriaceae bacterium]|nr:protein kinase [Kofleriaceae bacterium]